MARRLRWSLSAARHLEDICDYVGKDSARHARVLARRILDTAKSAVEYPHMGRMVPEYGMENLRERICHGYRVIYRVGNEVVRIVAIIHGARGIEEVQGDIDS